MMREVVALVSVLLVLSLLLLFTHYLAVKREQVLVYMLKHRYPLYGLDFVYARIAGQGSVYLVLQALEDEELIHSRIEQRMFDEKLPSKRVYELSILGAAVARRLDEIQMKKRAA
jgi:DNA-binding PadR family transcriptional regulator